MAKYINKDALVAEIERRIKEYQSTGDDYWFPVIENLKSILSFLDDLEVKEVDLEKEIEEHAIHMPMSEFTHDSEAEDFYEWAKEEFRHFFELGLKAQKGEQYDNTSR